jgi:ABC-type nitrate/sulfonate/bicarbonate transport system substrate-binding protein
VGVSALVACAAPAAQPAAAPSAAPGGAAAAKPAAAAPTTPAGADAAAGPGGAAVAPKPGPLHRIELGVVALAAYFYPMWVGIDKGFYAQQGLDVELTTLQTNEAVAALVSGSLDILMCPTDACVTAVSKGAEQRMVNDYLVEAPYNLMARADISTAAGLRDKKIGVSSLSAGTGSLAKILMRGQGFGPNDYQLVQAGGNPARFTALQSGGVDAALLTDPVNFAAMLEGYRSLLTFSQVVPEYSFTSNWVQNSWLNDAANREYLVAFQAAQIKAAQWARDPANKAAFLELIVRFARTTPEIAERIHQFYTVEKPDIVAVGDLKERPIQAVVDILREWEDLGPLPPDAAWKDGSYVQQARQLAAR